MIFSDIAEMVGGAAGIYGHKVNVPPLNAPDPQAVQTKTIAGNIAALPGAENLASEVNRFSTDQIAKMLGAVLPGYQSLFAKAGTNVADLLAGKLPTDVVNRVSDFSNARSFGSGTQGSAFGENLTLRDLGLTSLQAEQMGLSEFGNLLGMAESVTPQPFNFATAFLSPAQQVQNAYLQEQIQFGRDLAAARADAAPDPSVVAMAQGAGKTGDDIASLAAGGFGAGGMVGGGAGGASLMGGGSTGIGTLGGFANASGGSWIGTGLGY